MGNHNYALSECTNGWEKPQSPGFAPVSWKDGCPTFALAYSGLPVELSGVGSLHAAFLNESRTRCCWWSRVQEIRIRGTKTMFFECFHLIAHRNPFYGGWASPRLPGDSAVPRQIRGAEQRHLRQPIHGLSGQPVEGLYGQLKVFGTGVFRRVVAEPIQRLDKHHHHRNSRTRNLRGIVQRPRRQPV
jgi:hypothetical protein